MGHLETSGRVGWSDGRCVVREDGPVRGIRKVGVGDGFLRGVWTLQRRKEERLSLILRRKYWVVFRGDEFLRKESYRDRRRFRHGTGNSCPMTEDQDKESVTCSGATGVLSGSQLRYRTRVVWESPET